MTTAANETTTDVASTALSPGDDIISEQRGAIISETRGGFVGIGNLHISEYTAHEHVEKIRLAYGGAQRTFLISRTLFDGYLSFDEVLA